MERGQRRVLVSKACLDCSNNLKLLKETLIKIKKDQDSLALRLKALTGIS